MNVEHGLPCGLADVEHGAPAVGQPFVLGDLFGDDVQVADERGVGVGRAR